MDRRRFLRGLALGAMAAPRGARAQSAGKVDAPDSTVEAETRADRAATSINVALASAGGVASASSVYRYTPGYGGRSPQGGIGHGLYFGKCAEARMVDPDIDGTMLGHYRGSSGCGASVRR